LSLAYNKILQIGIRRILVLVFLPVLVCGCGVKSEPEVRSKVEPTAKPKIEAKVKPSAEANAVNQQVLMDEGSPVNQGTSKGLSKDAIPVTQAERAKVAKKEFTDEQLHKNNTLLMLAMEPDIRALALFKYLREYLTEEQKRAAVKLLLQHDDTFQELKRRRAAILENARDDQNVAEQLRRIKEETIIFSDAMRVKVEREIMTEEQRQKRAFDRRQAGEIK